MKRLLLCVSLGIAFSLSAFAQTVRTWVSTTGSDANPCSRAVPCRNFAAAIAAVDAGGEVVVLDSGGYGQVDIQKSVSLVAPLGVHAAIAPTAGFAIAILNSTTGPVVLRNLFLNSRGAQTGIGNGGNMRLYVDRCVISGFTFGIQIAPLFVSGGYSSVNGTRIENGFYGILGQPGGAAVFIDDSRLANHTNAGIANRGDIKMTVRNTVVGSSGTGFLAEPQAGASAAHLDVIDSAAVACTTGFAVRSSTVSQASMNLQHCLASKNNVGLSASATMSEPIATLRVSNSTIINNATGVSTLGLGAGVFSRENNTLESNGAGNTFPFLYAAK